MSETVLAPDLVAQVAALQRAVYELERSRLPQGSGTVSSGVDSLDPLVFRRDDAVNVGNEYYAAVATSAVPAAYTIVAWGDPADEPDLDRSIVNGVNAGTGGLALFAHCNASRDFTDFYWDGQRFSSDFSTAEFIWDAAQPGARTPVNGTRWAFGAMQTRASAAGFTQAELELTIEQNGSGGQFGDFQATFDINDPQYRFSVEYVFHDGYDTHVAFSQTAFGGPRFSVFDGVDTEQAAAVSVGGETAAVQAVYNALRAYGWFAA